MGEAADNLLSGLLCETCGELIDGQEPGYPRTCEACDRAPGDYEPYDDYQGTEDDHVDAT